MTFAGATTVTAVAALSATSVDAELLKSIGLRAVGAAGSRELCRVPDDKDDDDDDDHDEDDDDTA
jgi:hypothetical protein